MNPSVVSNFCCEAQEEIAAMRKVVGKENDDSCGEATPTTTDTECDDTSVETDASDTSSDTSEEGALVPQLGPGLFPSDTANDDTADVDDYDDDVPLVLTVDPIEHEVSSTKDPDATAESSRLTREETLFVFDWDDTVLPSTWIQRQGLRLDAGSQVQPWQRERLAEVAAVVGETLRFAKQRGTVVLLTNAEFGWIELSCQKFLPELLPVIENVKIVSARTLYETKTCTSPLDWKVLAFEAEIARACGSQTLVDPSKRKNILSLGDSTYEREALIRATKGLPNCRTKSLKFVERPDLSDILKQHALVAKCVDQITQHDDNLDLCINCD